MLRNRVKKLLPSGVPIKGLKRYSTAVSEFELSPRLRHKLVTALGYGTGSEAPYEIPHIDYILSQSPRPGPLDEYVGLILDIVQFFKNSEEDQSTEGSVQGCTKLKPSTIKDCIDGLVNNLQYPYFKEVHGHENRRETVVDCVLLILGSWVLMQTYFVLQPDDSRRILLAYCEKQSKENMEMLGVQVELPDLLFKSGLLPNPNECVIFDQKGAALSPQEAECNEFATSNALFTLHPSLGSVESLDIDAITLNASQLATLGAVRVIWTNNLSRHMLLSNHAKKYYLEVFAMPSALDCGPDKVLSRTGIPLTLMDEVLHSYANLFNPKRPSAWHTYLGMPFGIKFWCWCLSCSSMRLMKNELTKLKSTSPVDSTRPKYDPLLPKLMSTEADGWDQRGFRNLWPRLVALDAHLSGSKPWSFWVIFKDRRDSVQFWTFLFGTMILILTFVQVALGVGQVVSGFR